MDRIQKLNDIQDSQVKAWIDSGYNGTILSATGTGKSFTAQKAVYQALENGKLNLGDEIWLLAETKVRERTFFQQEIPKYAGQYGSNLLNDFNLKFFCYQSKPQANPAMIIADELDDAMTKEYHKVFENPGLKLGLTATNPANQSVYQDDLDYTQVNKIRQSDQLTGNKVVSKYVNKGQMFDIYCPICCTYYLDEAIADGILSPFETRIIEHDLDNTKPYIKIWKKYNTRVTEAQWWKKMSDVILDPSKPEGYKVMVKKNKMPRFLYRIHSKVNVTKDLLDDLSGKTVVFGIELDPLRKVTPYIVEDSYDILVNTGGSGLKRFHAPKDVKKYLGTGKRDLEGFENEKGKVLTFSKTSSEDILDMFDRGDVEVIASSKKIKRGVTLEGIQNLIFFSYYSTSYHFEQYLGRLLRYVPGKVGKVYIIRTKGTFEERWFKSLNVIKDYRNRTTRTIDLNIVE